MGFLDNLDSKISGMGKMIGGKVNDIADTYKIQTAISELETKKKETYTEIGNLYYNYYKQNRENPDNEALQLYKKIDELEQQSQQYAEQLQLLKGVVRCPNCQGEVPVDSMFCGKCGTKMPPRNMNNQGEGNAQPHSFCNNCGTPLDEGQRFCTVCGKEVENVIIQAQNLFDESQEELLMSGVENDEVVMDKQVENVDKICPGCGKTISDEQTFCIYCGTPLK